MSDYLVSFRIDVDADSPVQAAIEAVRIMREMDNPTLEVQAHLTDGRLGPVTDVDFEMLEDEEVSDV